MTIKMLMMMMIMLVAVDAVSPTWYYIRKWLNSILLHRMNTLKIKPFISSRLSLSRTLWWYLMVLLTQYVYNVIFTFSRWIRMEINETHCHFPCWGLRVFSRAEEANEVFGLYCNSTRTNKRTNNGGKSENTMATEWVKWLFAVHLFRKVICANKVRQSRRGKYRKEIVSIINKTGRWFNCGVVFLAHILNYRTSKLFPEKRFI